MRVRMNWVRRAGREVLLAEFTRLGTMPVVPVRVVAMLVEFTRVAAVLAVAVICGREAVSALSCIRILRA